MRVRNMKSAWRWTYLHLNKAARAGRPELDYAARKEAQEARYG
jgi:hypothetical protein